MKQKLIKQIVKIELEMFLSVNSKGRASCQENPEGFKFYRMIMFAEWSIDTLTSYLQDLKSANDEGKNLITLKYARMEGLIPVLNDNPLIEKIVDLNVFWVKDLVKRYPNLHRNARPVEEDRPGVTSTKTYCRGEMETYSDTTLENYYDDLLQYLDRGENPMEKRCLAMVAASGYSSLDAAEEALSRV